MRAREMGMRDADAVIRMADGWKIGSRCQSSSRYMVKERTRHLSMRGGSMHVIWKEEYRQTVHCTHLQAPVS